MAVSSGSVYLMFPPLGQVENITGIEDSILGPIPWIGAGKGTPDDDRGFFLLAPKGSL